MLGELLFCFVCFSVTCIFGGCFLFAFLRLIQYLEYRHCLHCPLKVEDVEDTYTCFLEELKNRKENNDETKPKV